MFHPVMLVLIAIHFVLSVLFAWAIVQKYKRYVNKHKKIKSVVIYC